MRSNEQDDINDERLTEVELKERTVQKEERKKWRNEEGLIDVSSVNKFSKEEFDELSQGRSVTDTLQANTGNFRGEVTYSYWWSQSGGIFYCYTSQYRITKFNNQEGGNKANLHFSFDSGQWWGNDSPDALWQDGAWHSYSRGGWIGVRNRQARVYARFDFDKSGNDPSADSFKIYHFA